MITNQFFDPDYLKYTRFYGINLLGVRAHNEMQWHSGIKKVILKPDSNQFVNNMVFILMNALKNYVVIPKWWMYI
jgi:hypothetical protein